MQATFTIPQERLDAASALLTTALLAPIFRRDRGAAGAETSTVPAKPAPAAREAVPA